MCACAFVCVYRCQNYYDGSDDFDYRNMQANSICQTDCIATNLELLTAGCVTRLKWSVNDSLKSLHFISNDFSDEFVVEKML